MNKEDYSSQQVAGRSTLFKLGCFNLSCLIISSETKKQFSGSSYHVNRILWRWKKKKGRQNSTVRPFPRQSQLANQISFVNYCRIDMERRSIDRFRSSWFSLLTTISHTWKAGAHGLQPYQATSDTGESIKFAGNLNSALVIFWFCINLCLSSTFIIYIYNMVPLTLRIISAIVYDIPWLKRKWFLRWKNYIALHLICTPL